MRRLLILVATIAGLAGGPAGADTLGEVRAGNAAFGEGRYEAAVEAYTRAILAGDLDPEALAVTFNNRGVAYSELGDYDRAIQDYNQALTLRPGDQTSIKNLRIGHVRRAGAYANLGEIDQAMTDYAKAIELEPDHAPTYVRRGQLRLEQGELELALADLRRAEQLDPGNREASQLRARAETSLAAVSGATAGTELSPPDAGTEAQPGAAGEPPAAIVAGEPAQPETPPATVAAPEPAAGEPPATTAAAPPSAETRPALPRVEVAEGPARRFRTIQAVNYREGPGNDYPRVGTLAGGTVVNVVGESRGWMMIRLQNGREGFVYQRWLEPVQE